MKSENTTPGAAEAAGEGSLVRRAGLSWGAIAAYNVPTLGIGYMFLLVNIYLMKFSTDVLLVPATAMGLIFGVSRIWDAVTDPLAGYFSDRTKLALGRRRPWLLAAILPIGIAFVMLWSPPASLSGDGLVAWMAVGVFLFYSSMTIVVVPHTSLGAELSDDHHERTRIFGARHAGWTLGSLAAIGGMAALISATDPRERAMWMALLAAIVTGALLLWAVFGLRERSEFQGKGAENPYAAFADVFRNPHAKILLAVFLIESLGGATIGILTPYVAEYIVGAPEKTALFIGLYMVPSLLSVPFWVWLSKRVGKKPMWLFSMVVTGLGFGAMIFVEEGSIVLISTLAVILGLGSGCGSVVSPSVQAEIIDYDELKTGQRKEGAYFAAWNFVFKSATGITLMLTGLILDASGFVPNVEQTESAKFALKALYALFPMGCYLVGSLIFTRFSLTEAKHDEILELLETRRSAERRES